MRWFPYSFWIRVISAAIALVTLAAPSAVPAQSPQERYRQAMALMEGEQWDRAVSLLREVVAAVPGNARLHNALGVALSSSGDADGAAVQFLRALELQPEYPSALKNPALHEMSRERQDAARIYLECLLRVSPGEPLAHQGLAEIALANDEFSVAIPHFERSHGVLARNPRLLVGFATALVETGRSEQAVLALEKVPSSAEPNLQFRVGLILARLERFPAAARAFERSTGANADPYELGFNLALSYLKAGRAGEEIRVAEAPLADGRGTAELHNLLSQAYERSSDSKSAYEALRTATDLDRADESNCVDLVALCLDRDATAIRTIA